MKCHSKSNSFVAAAEQVCHLGGQTQPVLGHRRRRGRRSIAWQAIPHLCSSNRTGIDREVRIPSPSLPLGSFGFPSSASFLGPPESSPKQRVNRLSRFCRTCGPVLARGRCRISPPRFLAECCKRQLNQVSLVLLYFRLSAFSDLY